MFKFKVGDKVKKLPYDIMYENTLTMSKINSDYHVGDYHICGLNKEEIDSICDTLTIKRCGRDCNAIYYDFEETGWCLYESMITSANPMLIELE